MTETSPQFREQRLSPRRNVAIPAFIVFEGARGRVSCIVRNISDGGAKLEVVGRVQVPLNFTLLIEGRMVPCRLVWRNLKEIGAEFGHTEFD